MKTPKLFSTKADRALAPEVVGEKRFIKRALPALRRANWQCELTARKGRPTKANPAGGMRVEIIDPKRERQRLLLKDNLRVVDELLYWARHADLALEFEKGRLIFAPWLTQKQLISAVRALGQGLWASHKAGQQPLQQVSQQMIDALYALGNKDVMLYALDLESDTDQWRPQNWLEALRDTNANYRKIYVQSLAANVRLIPEQQVLTQWVHRMMDGIDAAKWCDGALKEGQPLGQQVAETLRRNHPEEEQNEPLNEA